jgi:hypothetical protein
MSVVGGARGGHDGAVLEVRVLTGDDWPQWRQVRLAALSEAPYAYGSTYADWVDADERQWRDRLDGPGFHNVLVLLDGAGGHRHRHPDRRARRRRADLDVRLPGRPRARRR